MTVTANKIPKNIACKYALVSAQVFSQLVAFCNILYCFALSQVEISDSHR